MTESIGVQSAKRHLSEILERVEAGEEITIVRAGTPIARLLPAEEPAVRRLGFVREFPDLSERFFFDPLEDDELAGWEGR